MPSHDAHQAMGAWRVQSAEQCPPSVGRRRNCGIYKGLQVRQANAAIVDDGCQAITSLSRALGRRVELTDVGSLVWVLLGQMVPCDAIALFTLDEGAERITVRYAAGAYAGLLNGVTRPATTGVAGWAALHRRSVLNAEPVFDFGVDVRALRSSAVVPLVDNGTVVAVLALYSKNLLAFTDDDLSLLELLGPRLALALSNRSTGPADDALPVVPRPVLQFEPQETRAALQRQKRGSR
jgi:GAF domain-containing protein